MNDNRRLRDERALKIKELIPQWVEKIGRSAAVRRLAGWNLNVQTADKICGGTYAHTPRNVTAKILEEEMAKDGIVLSSEAAS
jgi:hypothetical protein